ncbi:GNAT family N-acetyltransferase [Formosa sp. Hel1_31_208]|uniref:GNAT family N-acetyltransferase n=1 Tax=Formosa sp. Hel1_31_208 TaxID=1798225 RepID=UPI0012FD82B4|nr:GNAT family N-acetyltransferase [Formosa sp. Hel1_31_208]
MRHSKNATFLFFRDFMEYHQDRFEDYSLMLYKEDLLIALLPANRANDLVFSHQGLSYGGLLLTSDSKFSDVLECFKVLLEHLKSHDVTVLKLKRLPRIYEQSLCDDIDYLLFKTKAQLDRRDIAMVIDVNNRINGLSSNRKRNLKKAKSHPIEIREVVQFDAFFNELLLPNLQQRYNTLPTHTVEEITVLQSRFPKHIKQFNAYFEEQLIAGVTVFSSQTVAHAQYISTINTHSHLGGLDAIFDYLINVAFKDKRYVSFGISNENNGEQINQGLLSWKESFGAHAVAHDFYSISTENYKMLEEVMI